MNFTLRMTGAFASTSAGVSLPLVTATAATIAGRPRKACSRAGLTMIAWLVRSDGDAAARIGAAAHAVDDRLQLRMDRVEPVRVDAAAAERGIEQVVRRVGDEDEVVVEEGLQAEPDRDLHPVRIEIDADAAVRRLRARHGGDVAQHALALAGQGAGEQGALGFERDVVGALRRAQRRHHHANDSDRHDRADRNHDARAHLAPTKRFAEAANIGPISGQVSHRCYFDVGG